MPNPMMWATGRPDDDLVVAEPRRPQRGARRLPDERAVREHRALRLAGGSRRVEERARRRRRRPGTAASDARRGPSVSSARADHERGAASRRRRGRPRRRVIWALTGTGRPPARATARHSRNWSSRSAVATTTGSPGGYRRCHRAGPVGHRSAASAEGERRDPTWSPSVDHAPVAVERGERDRQDRRASS